MSLVVGLLVACALGAMAVARWHAIKRATLLRASLPASDWHRIARYLDLGVMHADDGTIAVVGWRDGFSISVRRMPAAEDIGIPMLCVRPDPLGHWPHRIDIELRPVVDGEPSPDADGAAVVQTGSLPFDGALSVHGNRAEAMAVLDRATRAALLAMPRAQPAWGRAPDAWRIEGGGIEWELPFASPADPSVVGHYLDKLLALARILDRGGRSVQQCLADNARDDEPPLRVRHLAALAEAFPDDALTLGACRRALEDADPATRLVGARALGREGAPTLVAMASDESLEASRRVEALAAWEVLPPTPDEARALLDALLAGTHSDVRLAAIRAAGHLRCAAVLPALLRLAGRARNEHVRELAVAFEEMGDEAAESVLVDLLVAGGEAVPPEVLRALGSLGSAASVEPLLPLATELIVPRAVKRAAREALRAIRSRLGTADVGRLSLVDLDDDAGALSLPDGASGDVSLAPEGAREDAS